MKSILIVALVVVAASGVVLFSLKSTAAKSYPRETVISALGSGAAAIGGALEEHRSGSRMISCVGPLGLIRNKIRELTGQGNPDQVDVLLVRSGPEMLTVTCPSRLGKVQEIQIQPSPRISKPSADLGREILKGLPGLRLAP